MPPFLPSPRHTTLLGAALFGALIFLLLPATVVTLDDDFGYLRSVVETARRGRPWTDDWLEPWAASLSVLAALIFRVTGSFSLAIHGLLAIAGAAACAAAAALFRSRGFSAGRALGFSALLLTYPTLLWKGVEFTGLALYLPCLLLALGAAEQRRWVLFLLPWTLALATRQSALAWGVLPAVELGRLWLARDEEAGRSRLGRAVKVAAVGLTGLGVFLLMSRGMNKTHAQLLLTDHAFDHVAWREVLHGATVGALAFLGAAGLGGAVLRWQAGGSTVSRPSLPAMALTAIFTLLLVLVDLRETVSIEHPLFAGSMGWLYTKLLLVLAAAGWVTGGFALRPTHVCYAVASLALVCLRAQVWDYYLIDVAVFGFFAPAASAASAPVAKPLPRWVWAAPVVVAGFHLGFVGELKATLDRARALCLLGEGALRAGRLEAAELGFAPFGFAGWHLYPGFVARDGRADADIAGFTRYLRPGAVEVGQGYSRALHIFPRFRHEPPADRSNVVASGRYRVGWFFQGDYFLLRFKTAAEAPPALALPADYRTPVFPRDDAEWRQLIASPTAP